MKPILLIDFGSTFTKVTAVDVDAPAILATAASYTTVETDITTGLDRAVEELLAKTGPLDFAHSYACSSAAGGLKMVTSGLVESLTSEAAKCASLGAGAKVAAVYSFELTEYDVREIIGMKPDILLLCGGTDGGNKACALHNAGMLASAGVSFPVIVACNRAASAQCEDILTRAGVRTYRCENVMPSFNKLNIEPAQSVIREVCLRRIVEAKGLDRANSRIEGVTMPTPAAVMQAVTLLSQGIDGAGGLGELMAVDVGGATTDVYSIAHGYPTYPNAVVHGLPEPFAKRTVEGDIGMRYSAEGILEAAGMERVMALSGLGEEQISRCLARIHEYYGEVPGDDGDFRAFDGALATLAVETAVRRHCGTIEEVYTPAGKVFLQTGKDLTEVTTLVATGGPIIHNPAAEELVLRGLTDGDWEGRLRPRSARVLIDKNYILAAMGLLSVHYPEAALQLMREELTRDGTAQ